MHRAGHGTYVAKVTVQNTSAETIKGWSVGWTFPGSDVVKRSWNTALTQAGAEVTATNVKWNSTVKKGHKVSFGFIGTGGPTMPETFTLNGAVCD